MRTIATLQEPDSGTTRLGVLEQKDAVRRVSGYLPQEFGFYPNLPAEAVLAQLDCAKRFHALPCTTSQELGIDPYNRLIDRVSNNNIMAVTAAH